MTWLKPLMDVERRRAVDPLLQMDSDCGENRRLHDDTRGKLQHTAYRSFAALFWYGSIIQRFSLLRTKAL